MPLLNLDHAGRDSDRRTWQEPSRAYVQTAATIGMLSESDAAVNLLCLYLLLTQQQQWLQCQVVLLVQHDYITQ